MVGGLICKQEPELIIPPLAVNSQKHPKLRKSLIHKDSYCGLICNGGEKKFLNKLDVPQ